MSRVVHFEIQSESPERVSAFYSTVFGWQIQKNWSGNEDYWLVRTGMSSESGINGGIKKSMFGRALSMPTVEVSDLEETAKLVVQNGGKKVSEKISIEGTGQLMYCQDPEGTLFQIIQKE